MTIEHIAEPADDRLSLYRDVTDSTLLREHARFVAEGRLVVERLLAERRYIIESILLNQASLVALHPALTAAEADGVQLNVFVCPTTLFAALTGVNIHRGCLALVRRPQPAHWETVVAGARLLIVLEAVTNADNVGSVFRNAAAFGADAILLSPTTCDPLYRKAIRTSMGAAFRVPWATMTPWPDALAGLVRTGVRIVELSPREPAHTLRAWAASRGSEPIALLLGTEGAGVSEAASSHAEVRVRIPMAPGTDSLNLAVASGIALAALADDAVDVPEALGLFHP